MPDSIEQLLLPITGALFVFALLLMVFSLRLFRRSRNDIFWRQRRQAGQRGWRIFVLAIVLLLASGFTCGLSGLAMLIDNDEPDSPGTAVAAPPSLTPDTVPSPATVEPSPTESEKTAIGIDNSSTTPPPVDQIAGTPPGSVIVVVTATPAVTPSLTVFPTFTPIVTPLNSTVTPLPYAQLRITALDDRISDTLQPLNPRQQFDAGTTRLYLFVEFRSMTAGVMWRRELRREGSTIEENAYLWGLESTGSSYFFFGDDNGFEPGDYEVRVYIGAATEPASTMTFTIVG